MPINPCHLRISDIHTLVDVLQRVFFAHGKVLGGPTTCCSKWSLTDMIQGGLGGLGYKRYAVQSILLTPVMGTLSRILTSRFFFDHSKGALFGPSDQRGFFLSAGSDIFCNVRTTMMSLLLSHNRFQCSLLNTTVSCSGSMISDVVSLFALLHKLRDPMKYA
jgi:hypothetical protein